MNAKRICWFCDKPLPPDAPDKGNCPDCKTPYEFPSPVSDGDNVIPLKTFPNPASPSAPAKCFYHPLKKGGIYELEGIEIKPDRWRKGRYLAWFKAIENGEKVFFPLRWEGRPMRSDANAYKLGKIVFGEELENITAKEFFPRLEKSFPGVKCKGLLGWVREDTQGKKKPKSKQYLRVKELYPLETHFEHQNRGVVKSSKPS